MDDSGREHGDDAIFALADERFDLAGDRYTLSAYGTLAGFENRHREAFDGEHAGWAGFAVCDLLRAAVCYRIAGATDRARNRAGQAILAVGDQRDHVVDAAVDRAACHELVGVARAVTGDAEQASAAFDRAEAGYESADVDDGFQATTRPLLQAGTDLVTHLSRPDDVEWDEIHGPNRDEALVRRVRFVRNRIGSMADARVKAGKLHAPRGSTEYGNDGYRCPECGANDINHVAETVLCLRCSAQSDRV
jgi:hypothetical protein